MQSQGASNYWFCTLISLQNVIILLLSRTVTCLLEQLGNNERMEQRPPRRAPLENIFLYKHSLQKQVQEVYADLV